MENILFVYNIILTVFFSMMVAGFYIAYAKGGKKEFLISSILFIFMIVENSLAYISEFSNDFKSLHQTSELLYAFIYIVFLGVSFTLRLAVGQYLETVMSKREKTSWAVTAAAIAATSFILPVQTGDMLAYSSFYTAILYVSFVFYKNLKRDGREASARRIMTCRLLALSTGILCIAGVADSVFYFMSYDIGGKISDDALSFEYRNIAFDAIKMMIGAALAVRLKYVFENIFDKDSGAESSMEERVATLCAEYSLTNRQCEILGLVIEGNSNREIGEKLHITEGTVKTHIYNIFKKIGISSRNQLMKVIMNQK